MLSRYEDVSEGTPDLEKLIVIGCSFLGKSAVEYLIPRLNLSSSAAVVVPHIENREIYNSLADSGINVMGIDHEIDVKKGYTYVVQHTYPGSFFLNGRPFFENVKDLFKTIRFKNNRVQPAYSFFTLRINYAMKSAAKSYHDRCIGVILSGSGDDGSSGVREIKEHGGRVLVQVGESYIYGRGYSGGMPESAQKATDVDFAGPLSELVNILNERFLC